jgi:hypothetical protein
VSPVKIETKVTGKILEATFTLPSGRPIEVHEPIPEWMFKDPTLDYLSGSRHLWGICVADALSSKQSMNRYWGDAKDLT